MLDRRLVVAAAALWTIICLLWCGSTQVPGVKIYYGTQSPTAGVQQRPEGSWPKDWDTYYLSASQRCRPPAAVEHSSVPQLHLVGTWQGSPGANHSHVTVVTHLPLDRLDQLERQCLAWPHALAAAVYMPLADGLASWPPSTKGGLAVEKAILKVASFHARMHHQPVRGGCNLSLHLYVEPGLAAKQPYPSTAMRNRALQVAEKAEAVLLLDMDAVVYRQFGTSLDSPQDWQPLMQQLYITPAIMLPWYDVNMPWLGSQWTGDWQKNWTSGVTEGQRCFESKEWYKKDDFWGPTLECLPYLDGGILMYREHMPWFDERLRSLDQEKELWYMTMWHWGVSFAVHPWAYIERTAPFEATSTKQLASQAGSNIKADLERHQYHPVTSFGQQCQLQSGKMPGTFYRCDPSVCTTHSPCECPTFTKKTPQPTSSDHYFVRNHNQQCRTHGSNQEAHAQLKKIRPSFAQVINLDRAPQRLQHFWEQVASSDLPPGLEVRRLPANDSSQLELASLLSGRALNELEEAGRLGHRTYHYQLTRGAVGIYLSHMRAWQAVLDSKADMGVVFEDDVVLMGSFWDTLYSKVAPADFDILLLDGECLRCSWSCIPGSNSRRVERFYNLQAYMISAPGARRILQSGRLHPIAQQIDSALSDMAAEGLINVYMLDERMAWQNGSLGVSQMPVIELGGINPYAAMAGGN